MNYQQSINFIKWHARGETVLLTAIVPDGAAQSEMFRVKDDKRIEAWLKKHADKNIYYHVNEVPDPERDEQGRPKKGTKDRVPIVYYLHIDIDPPKDGTKTAEWDAETKAKLEAYSPPPSTIIHSGNGWQALWELSPPVDVALAGGPDEVARYNWHLALDLGGDVPTRDVSRILRLPGTTNWPTKKKREAGFVKCETKWHPIGEKRRRVYQLTEFKKASDAEMVKKEKPKAEKVSLGDAEPFKTIEEVKALKSKKWDDLRAKIVRQPEKGEDRSATVWNAIHDMIRAGLDDRTIGRVLLSKAFGISSHIYDQKAPKAYTEKQIGTARASVKDWVIGENGIVPNHQGNIRTALGKMEVKLSHDVFSDRLWFERKGAWAPLDDPALVRLWLEVDETFGFRPTKEFFQDVTLDAARANTTHPVRDYLDKLKWDGEERLASWLIRLGGAPDNEYVRTVGRLVLIAAVRRIRKPGCKFDEMLVLESAQGTLKSSALAALAVEDEWFSDDLPLNAESKLVIERTQGKWIIEASELKGMRKGEIEHLKSFLSRRFDRARLAYGRVPTETPRQFVVVGSTNSEKYLRDPTGNRRFWPVRVTRFDVDALIAERDQLWAEAALAEAKGESIRLDPRLWSFAGREQEERAADDPWIDLLRERIDRREGRIGVLDAWKLVGVSDAQRTQEMSVRLGEAFRALGWERKQLRSGNGSELHGSERTYFFVKGDAKNKQWPTIKVMMAMGAEAPTVHYDDTALEKAHRDGRQEEPSHGAI